MFGALDGRARGAGGTQAAGCGLVLDQQDLAGLALVRKSRLSVLPVNADDWKIICKMGKTRP